MSETGATLKVDGDALEPDEISALLKVPASWSVKKGELLDHPPVKPNVLAKAGVWLRRVDRRQDGNLDAQIVDLLGTCTDDLTAWRELTTKFRVEISCVVYLAKANEGLDLLPETLDLISSRGLRLSFDIYR
ncbi:hypothetical protein MAUB1S_06129 [Mycolicibacterium aubagnense]